MLNLEWFKVFDAWVSVKGIRRVSDEFEGEKEDDNDKYCVVNGSLLIVI